MPFEIGSASFRKVVGQQPWSHDSLDHLHDRKFAQLRHATFVAQSYGWFV